MTDELSGIARRTNRWKFTAGTTELMLGGVFFWAGLALLLPRKPTFNIGLLVIGIVLSGFLINYLQNRFIYPRIGYLEYRLRPRKGIWMLVFVLIISLVSIGGMLVLNLIIPDILRSPVWFTPALTLLVGIAIFVNAFLVKQVRFFLLGLISLTAGIFLSPLGLGKVLASDPFGIDKLGLFFLIMGVSSLFSGGSAFRVFLRQTPLMEETPDEL
jgi:hypothetical protein